MTFIHESCSHLTSLSSICICGADTPSPTAPSCLRHITHTHIHIHIHSHGLRYSHTRKQFVPVSSMLSFFPRTLTVNIFSANPRVELWLLLTYIAVPTVEAGPYFQLLVFKLSFKYIKIYEVGPTTYKIL